MLEGRIVTSGLMLAIFATAVVIALVYFAPGARMLPLAIGIPGLILSALQFVIELRQTDAKKFTPEVRKKELLMVVCFGVFAAAIIAFGFIFASPVLIAGYLLIVGREKWYVALIGAILVWATLNYIFEEFIGIILFEGVIPPMLMGY